MKKSLSLDIIFVSCCFLSLMLAGIALIWNFYHQDYYLDFQWTNSSGVYLVAIFCVIYVITVWAPISYPLIVAVCKSIAMLYISLAILELCNTAILTTPFPTHDYFIHHIDQSLGFHLLPILQFVKKYSMIDSTIWFFYYSVLITMHFLPVTLAVIDKQRVLYHYFISFLLSIIIGYAIYYFFPTMTSPAAIYPSQYFTSFQLNTLHQFQLEHLHKIIHFNLIGGVISFPSYHAIWATLVVYFLWPDHWIRLIALLYGIIALCAVILSGWHYFSDLIAGVIIALVSIYLGRWLCFLACADDA